MERENVRGYRIGISYTCTALRYKPAFIATWVPGSIFGRGMEISSESVTYLNFITYYFNSILRAGPRFQ